MSQGSGGYKDQRVIGRIMGVIRDIDVIMIMGVIRAMGIIRIMGSPLGGLRPPRPPLQLEGCRPPRPMKSPHSKAGGHMDYRPMEYAL